MLPTVPVLLLVEPEQNLRPEHENGSLDQVGLFHHQVYRLLLRAGQGAMFEDGTARAHEIEKAIGIDVPLEKRTIGWIAVDVPLFDLNTKLVQITSGIAARRSGRFPVKRRLQHARILEQLPARTI
jgi:hypothetical protein